MLAMLCLITAHLDPCEILSVCLGQISFDVVLRMEDTILKDLLYFFHLDCSFSINAASLSLLFIEGFAQNIFIYFTFKHGSKPLVIK
jgi:hypothetical protein